MLIAINTNFVGKPSSDTLMRFNHAFIPQDISVSELAELVKKGFAFCPHFSRNRRQSSNFKASGYLAVDVDHGLSIEVAQESEFYQNYASMLYTTTNHKPDAHRFRIVFELEEAIVDTKVMKLALTGLISKFGGDESCTDACRIFFGSKDCEPILHGKKMPKAVVEELVLRGQELSVRTDNKNDISSPLITVASRILLPVDTLIRTERGAVLRLAEIPEKTRVHCPQHIDNRPSAFTLRSQRGVPGIHCKSCNATFFIKQHEALTPYHYDFDYDWRRILNLSYDEYTAHADENGHVDISDVRGGDIRLFDVQYLPFDESPVVSQKIQAPKSKAKHDAFNDLLSVPDERFISEFDITFIKSPKGSGKTEWLQKLVARHKEAGNRVLLIGHRRTLINATSARLGLTSYLNMKGGAIKTDEIAEVFQDSQDDFPERDTDNEIIQEGYNAPTSHYAICLDSLPTRLDTRCDKYDLILIDEVEQVFSHLLSRTLKDSRREVILHLRHYLQAAKAIYLLDADLNRVTVEVLDTFLNGQKPRWQALVNRPIPQNRVLYLYEGERKDALTGELVAALSRGERCFVTTNSLRWTEGLAVQMAKACQRDIRAIVINSKTAKTPHVQGFIANIKDQAPLYDLIVASPSIGTGIDITFDDGAQLIDAVFGFFETRINTHFDIDQQLARVRNPKRINVWISPETYSFQTDPAVIASEIESMESEFKKLIDITPDGEKVYFQDTAGAIYAKIYASVSASRRASINNLRQNFIDLRRSNGWTVEYVKPDKELISAGREVAKAKRAADKEKILESIMNARKLDMDEYRQLNRKPVEKQTDVERDALERFKLESFYCRDATPELINDDRNWYLRKAIQNYQLLMASDEMLRDRDQEQKSELFHDRRNRQMKKRLLVNLLTASGLYADGVFNTEIEVTTANLQAFAKKCEKEKGKIEELFNVAVRSDVFKKPKQQLEAIVDLLGLTFKAPRIEQIEGKKRYFYRLNENALNHVRSWVEELANPELRAEWEASRSVDSITRGIDAIQQRKAHAEESLT